MEEIKMQDLKTVKHKPQVHSQATIWENVCFFKLIILYAYKKPSNTTEDLKD